MTTTRCQDHFDPLPCARCEENERRGYAVMMLAGRCANGSELDHGTKWHAVRPGEYAALCGAKPGRRSAGWSSYTALGQPATCPRCLKKLGHVPINVDHLIASRNRLTDRRDGLTDSKRVARIDAQLATVPAGERNDVDLLLGRLCATPTPRADYSDMLLDKCAAIVAVLQRDYIDSQSAATEQAAPIAAEMQRKYHTWAGCAGNSADEYDSSTEGHW